MLDDLFCWVGMYYRETLYLGGSKIAGMICSYADIFVIAAFIKVMDIIHKRPASRKLYIILFIFAALTPLLLIPRITLNFFILQFIVLAPPYLILVFTAVNESKYFVAYVKEHLKK